MECKEKKKGPHVYLWPRVVTHLDKWHLHLKWCGSEGIWMCSILPAILTSIAVGTHNVAHLILKTRPVVNFLLNAATEKPLEKKKKKVKQKDGKSERERDGCGVREKSE